MNTRKDKNDICFMFYIWLKQTNQLIGRVYFHSKYELGGEVEIGYGVNEEHRNKGYATEAAKAVVRFAFEQAEQEELAAIVKRENIASRRVVEKLGFTYRGIRTVFDEGKDCEFDYFKLFPIHYRMAKVSDAPELKRLNDLFNKNNANTLEAIKEILRGNGSEIVCVAVDGNSLVGFCCGYILKYMCFTFLYGEITEFFVMDEYRRQGIGKKLLAYTEAAFRKQGVKDFYVLTGQKNIAAQSLYAASGFSDTHEILFEKRNKE